MLKLYVWRIVLDKEMHIRNPWYAEIAPADARPTGQRIYEIDTDSVLIRDSFPTQEEAIHNGLKLLQVMEGK